MVNAVQAGSLVGDWNNQCNPEPWPCRERAAGGGGVSLGSLGGAVGRLWALRNESCCRFTGPTGRLKPLYFFRYSQLEPLRSIGFDNMTA